MNSRQFIHEGPHGMAIIFDVSRLNQTERDDLLAMINEEVTGTPPPHPAEIRLFTGDDGHDRIAICATTHPIGVSEGCQDGTTAVIFPISPATDGDTQESQTA